MSFSGLISVIEGHPGLRQIGAGYISPVSKSFSMKILIRTLYCRFLYAFVDICY